MKTYLVMIDDKYYVDVYEEALKGYSTTGHEEEAVVLYYQEAADLCFLINKSAGRLDKAVMVDAIELDDEEERDDRDEDQKRADAMAERADDSRDDR